MSRNTHRARRVRRRRRGLTLIELMAVLVLLGLLAGITTTVIRSYMITGKQRIARLEIAKISEALEGYHTAHDKYPSSDQGLEVLVEPSDEFPEGLLTKFPTDPWGNPYEYIQPGRDAPYEVISYGADGQEGGEGADRDISSADTKTDDQL